LLATTANDITADAGQFLFIPDFEKRRAAAFAMKKGEAASIYDAWFGPRSDNPLPRGFRIQRE